MNDIRKMLWVKVLYSTRFWIPTFVLYLNSRGVETSQVLFLLGAYYVAVIALEYPTGVVGDVFSHRVSILSGYALLAVGYLLIAFPMFAGMGFFYGAIMFVALGESLISGSDIALLHDVSRNFSNDYPRIKTVSQVVSFVTLSIGGFVATIDLRLPLVLSALSMIAAALFAMSVSYRPVKRDSEANIIGTALVGLMSVKGSAILRNLVLLSLLVGSFLFSLKWLYNDLFSQISLPVFWWGVVPGVATLFVAIGTMTYRKFPKVPMWTVFIALAAVVPLIGFTWWSLMPVFAIVVVHFLRGYLESRIMVDINAEIPSGVRSSVLSLNSLLQRLGASGYMFVGSQLIATVPLSLFLGCSGLFIAFTGIVPLLSLAGKRRPPSSVTYVSN
ncbi:MAG: MFS transporter [Candidatus Moranbacteria bacterium]|nr:MFS transporter [Candidatus Moranbacteria bacterium]